MCGIAGSNNPERAFKLYQSNLDRGYYSSSVMTVNGYGECHIRKVLGTFDEPVVPYPSLYSFYHSRGPTVETKEFVPDNNHPFEYKEWIVAHNGIISNFDALCKEFFPDEDFAGKTDSCIIPRLFSVLPDFIDGLRRLEGTFALWIHNKQTKKSYICRSASTLFINANTGDFSSTEFEESTSVPEGTIYELNDYNFLKEFNRIVTKSPYFFIDFD